MTCSEKGASILGPGENSEEGWGDVEDAGDRANGKRGSIRGSVRSVGAGMLASGGMGMAVNFTLDNGDSGLFMISECHSPFISSVSCDIVTSVRRGRCSRSLFCNLILSLL